MSLVTRAMRLAIILFCLPLSLAALEPDWSIEGIFTSDQLQLKELLDNGSGYFLFIQSNCSHCLRQLKILQGCSLKPWILTTQKKSRKVQKKYAAFGMRDRFYFLKARYQSPTPQHVLFGPSQKVVWQHMGVLECEQIKNKTSLILREVL